MFNDDDYEASEELREQTRIINVHFHHPGIFLKIALAKLDDAWLSDKVQNFLILLFDERRNFIHCLSLKGKSSPTMTGDKKDFSRFFTNSGFVEGWESEKERLKMLFLISEIKNFDSFRNCAVIERKWILCFGEWMDFTIIRSSSIYINSLHLIFLIHLFTPSLSLNTMINRDETWLEILKLFISQF